MIKHHRQHLALVGRLLLAALFLPAGFSKIAGFAGTVGYIASVGLPMASLAAIAAVVVEVAGGLALIAGFRTRSRGPGAGAVHPGRLRLLPRLLGACRPTRQMVTELLFFKNIAVVGGLLMLAAFGAGAWSLDARRKA